jgi:hypothetical protein
MPFLSYFETDTAHHYYLLERQNQEALSKVKVNYLLSSRKESASLFVATIPLELGCGFLHG